MKFKAAILREINKPLEIAEIRLAESLKSGQIIVKHLVSDLCGAQLQEIKGYKNPKLVPRLLGHGSGGVVVEVGPGVKKVKNGDTVCTHWRKGSGIECDFPQYNYQGRIISSGLITTFAEYSIVSENRLTKINNDNNDIVALMGCALSTAIATVNKVANVKYGETVLIIGSEGGVGNALVWSSLALGSTVTGVDIKDSCRNNWKGYTYGLQSDNDKFDVIISTVGNPKIIEKYYPNLATSGRFVLVGQPKPGESIIIPNGLNMFGGEGQKFIVSEGGSLDPDYDIPRYLNQTPKFISKSLVSHQFNLEDINKAFDVLESGQATRILIDL